MVIKHSIEILQAVQHCFLQCIWVFPHCLWVVRIEMDPENWTRYTRTHGEKSVTLGVFFKLSFPHSGIKLAQREPRLLNPWTLDTCLHALVVQPYICFLLMMQSNQPCNFFLKKKGWSVCMLCLYVCMCSSCMHDDCRGWRGLGIPWNWSSRQLWTTKWVLWAELKTFESVGTAFNCRVFSLVPHCNHFCVCSSGVNFTLPMCKTPNLPFSGWLFSFFYWDLILVCTFQERWWIYRHVHWSQCI